MRFYKEYLLLYGITDCSEGYLARVESALKNGITLLQLRDKEKTGAELIEAGKALKVLCSRYDVPLIVNDSVEIALASGADGVHVGAEDTPAAEARRRCGDAVIVGATAKTVEQARQAEAAGADYLGVGAVFQSPTKRNAIRITCAQFREIADAVRIPCVAIGGITLDNMDELRGCGAAGAAVVSAIFSATDTAAATTALKEKAKIIFRS